MFINNYYMCTGILCNTPPFNLTTKKYNYYNMFINNYYMCTGILCNTSLFNLTTKKYNYYYMFINNQGRAINLKKYDFFA